jgi:hypothetical protein
MGGDTVGYWGGGAEWQRDCVAVGQWAERSVRAEWQ